MHAMHAMHAHPRTWVNCELTIWAKLQRNAAFPAALISFGQSFPQDKVGTMVKSPTTSQKGISTSQGFFCNVDML